MQSTLEPAQRGSLVGLRRHLGARPYLRHNALLLGATLVSGAFNFAFHPALGRLLGVSAYGTVATLLNLLTILLIPTAIIVAIVVRYTSAFSAAGQYDQLHDLVRRLMALLLPLGVGMALVFALVSGPLAAFLHLRSAQALLILGLAFTISFASPINLGAVQGLQRFGWFATLTVMPSILRLLLAASLALLGLGVNGAVLGIVLSTVLPYLISFQPLRALLAGPRLPTVSLRSLWSYSVRTGIALACMTLLFNLDTVLAKHFLAAQQAGFYAALSTLGKTSLFISGSVVAVMFPRVAALHTRGEPTVRVAVQSLLGVLALSMAAEAIFIAVPTLMVDVFDRTFAAVAGQLAWYGLGMLLLAQAQALIYYFLATGERIFVLILLVCCALMPALIALHHQTVAEIVQAVVSANGLLFVLLLALFVLRKERRPGADVPLAAGRHG